jgi:hypothetical protein
VTLTKARLLLLSPLLFAACDTPPGGGGSVVAGDTVLVNGDTPADRARAAWAAAPQAGFADAIVQMEKDKPVTLDAGAAALFKAVGGKIAVDAPGAVRGLPEGTETIDLAAASFADVVMGDDEGALAEALRSAGARVLVLHTALRPSFNRDRHVLSRLYHHAHLDHFQLARVEEGLFVYLVNDAPIRFEPALADASIRWLREELSGKRPPPMPPVKSDSGKWLLVTSVRGHGQELAFSLAEGSTLDVALRETADDLEAAHRRNREVLGFPRLSEHIEDLVIEIHRVKERAMVVPRGEDELKALWEMGLDGAILLDKVGDRKKSAVWPGAVAVSRGITNGDSFLRAMAREAQWDMPRPWRDDPDVTLELIRTSDYREVRGEPVVAMYRGSSLMPMDGVTLDSVKGSIVYAGEWWLANLQPDGTVTYKFWPEENRFSNEYNHVRHELATWNLWQAWTLDPRPEFLEGAIRAQDWTLRSLVERDASNFDPWERELVDASPHKDAIYKDGIAYFTYGNNTKLGSAVVGLYGMIEVARATNDHGKDALMRDLGRYILLSQLPEGNFRPYHVPPGHPYEHEKNDIVPGEAALALVMLSEYFDDPTYLDAVARFFEYYKPWYAERAKRRNDRAPWPAFLYDNQTRLDLVQFGPWTVMAANAFTRNRPERTDIVDFGLEVAKWMIETYEYSSERAPYPDYIGGYYKFEGELPAMQAFCYGEGTAAAYQMALRARPDQAQYFEKATRETVRIAMQMQHDRLDSLYYARPELIEGGVRYALNEPKVRVDYTYHAQSTMFQWYVAAKDDPGLPASVRATPGEAAQKFLRMADIPGFRAPGAPVRTSQPAAPPVAAAPSAGPVNPASPPVIQRDDEGGE